MTAIAAKPLGTTRTLILNGVIVLALSALLALSARIQVPFFPVPMTLQTLAVLGIAGFMGPSIAGGAFLAYLAEGAAGLPVFASGAGLPYMMGPTGGYLAGMLLASVAVAAMVRLAKGGIVLTVLAMLAGVVLVYVPGTLWLAQFVGAGGAYDLSVAFAKGVEPFMIGDAAKALLAAAAVLLARPAARA